MTSRPQESAEPVALRDDLAEKLADLRRWSGLAPAGACAELERDEVRRLIHHLDDSADLIARQAAELERHASDRQYIVGWNAGFEHVHGPLRFPTMLRKMWSGGEVQAWLDAQRVEAARQAAADEGCAASQLQNALTAAEAENTRLRAGLVPIVNRLNEIEEIKAVAKFAIEGTAAVKISLLRDARQSLTPARTEESRDDHANS